MVRPSSLKNPLQALPALRLVLLAMAAVVALAVPASASAYQGVEVESPEEAYPVAFTANSSEQVVLRRGTVETFSCESSSGSGKWTSGSSGTAVLAFNKCKLSASGQPCTIVSNQLTIKPVFLDAAQTKVGILFSPPASGKFSESPCLGFWGQWNGSLIGEVVGGVNEEVTANQLRFEAVSHGVQRYRQVEGAGPIFQLTWPTKSMSIENKAQLTYQSPVVYRGY